VAAKSVGVKRRAKQRAVVLVRSLHYCPSCSLVTMTWGPKPCMGIVMLWAHPRCMTVAV